MLSPADAALVNRDPRLAGLSLLLDPEAMSQTLRQKMPQIEVEAVRATYVRYKPQTSCLVGYRLQTAVAEVDFYAKAYRLDAHDKLNKARLKSNPVTPATLGISILDDVAVILYPFPNDHTLPILPRLVNPHARQQLLTRLLPNQPQLWQAQLYPLRYKPERRYVGQLVAENGDCAVLKAYTVADFQRIDNNFKAFCSNGTVRLAQQAGRSSGHQLIALAWLPGQTLEQVSQSSSFEPGVAQSVGAALAQLHGKNSAHLMQRFDARAALSAAVKSVTAVCPHLAEQVRKLAGQLTLDLLHMPNPHVPLHGDFSADQVLLTDTGLVFLDFDRVARGDPAADLGSFIAQLEYDVLLGRLPAQLSAALQAGLVAGYRRAAPHGVPAGLSSHIVAGLVQRVAHPFRNREPNWPDHIEAILQRAWEIFSHA